MVYAHSFISLKKCFMLFTQNQRRQQKIQGKVLHLNDLGTIDHPEDSECDAEMSAQGEVGVRSDHVSQEEVISEEYCDNQKDLNGQENMVESVTDTQKCTEGVDMDNDLEVLSSPAEHPGNLNGACVEDGGPGEEDVLRGFRNLNLDAALHPDDIHVEILNGSPAPGTKAYEAVNQDPATAFCTLASRQAVGADEGSIRHCLYQFTRNEGLRGANKLLCEVCTRRQLSAPKANPKGTGLLAESNLSVWGTSACIGRQPYWVRTCMASSKEIVCWGAGGPPVSRPACWRATFTAASWQAARLVSFRLFPPALDGRPACPQEATLGFLRDRRDCGVQGTGSPVISLRHGARGPGGVGGRSGGA